MAAINLGKATDIIPELKELISLIQVKRPLFEFRATGFRQITNHANVTTVWVSEFEVTQDVDVVGEIAYRSGLGRKQPDGTYPDAYTISSEHIKKERGERNKIITFSTVTALKHVIKSFAPPSVGSMCNRLIAKVRSGFETYDYQWRSAINDVSMYNGVDILEWIIESHIQGQTLPMPKSCKVYESKIHLYHKHLAGKALKALSKHTSMVGADRGGYVVSVLPDKTMRVLPFAYEARHSYEQNELCNNVLVRYRNYEEMPIRMQEQIAVLKVAAENEPIENIGVKFRDVMYILG